MSSRRTVELGGLRRAGPTAVLRGLRRAGPPVLIIAITLFVFSAWLTNHAIETHEGIDPYVRTQQIVEEVGNGNFPPQVLPDARLGAGTAFPRFYPPLPFLASALIAAITGDVVVGVNLSLVIAGVASGFSMAWAVRRVGGDRWLAAGAAAIYVATPYHVFDANVRGALAEMWAFVWFPLLFVAAWRTIERQRLDLVLPVATAGLLLSHTISILVAAFALGFFALTGVLRRSWQGLGAFVAGCALGVGLSAAYLVPQQLELGDVLANDPPVMLATDAALDAARVPLGDLIGDASNLFRGYSDAPTLPTGKPCELYFCGGRNLIVGPIALALPVFGALMFARHRRRAELETDMGNLRPFAVVLGAAIIAWLSFIVRPALFTTLLPEPIAYLQFPWRALAPIAAAVAILWALLLRDRRYGGAALAGLGVVAALALPGVQRNPVDRPDQKDRCFTSADVRAPRDSPRDACFRLGDDFDPAATGEGDTRELRSAYGFTTRFEYLPTSVRTTDPAAGVTPEPIIEGPGAVVEWKRTGDGMRVEVNTTAEATVRIPITAYRFTRVSVDSAPSSRADLWSRADRLGLVGVRVGPGRSTITVSRGRTAGDRIGALLTLASMAIVTALALQRHRIPSPTPTPHRERLPE